MAGGSTTGEQDRLRALATFALLDTPPERHFDEITRLASALLRTNSAAISLIDDKRQWFKSRVGIPFTETPRNQAFCNYAVDTGAFFEVQDASLDSRFADNPLVTCDGGIRFYAGAPLIVDSGHCLGTLCVFDPEPRQPLSPDERQALTDLASLAVERIEARHAHRLNMIAAGMVDAVSDAMLGVDAEHRISYWNRAAESMFGYSAEEAIGRSLDLILPGRERADHRYQSLLRTLARRSKRSRKVLQFEGRRASAECFPAELSVADWGEAGTDHHAYAVIIRDVTDQRREERKNAQTRRFLDTIVANLPAMLFVKDSISRRYELLNRAGEEFIGLPAADVIGRTDKDLFPSVGGDYHARDSQVIAGGRIQSYESDFHREDGRVVRLRTKRIIVDGPDRPGQFILGMSEDVTDIREAQARILQLAHYDALTGLLNRSSFLERLEKFVEEGKPFAVLTIDLDRFKAINDQFGHLVGDEVLIQAADRLRRVAQSAEFVARVGGDEFIIVLTSGDIAERSRRLAAMLVHEIGEPYQLERFVAHTGVSIGVVLSPQDGTNVGDLRQAADLAMYRAKAGGGGAACFFSAEMDRAARDRRLLETDLRHAVEHRQIDVAYQPVVSTNTGQITSFEALARWTHPERGPIAPDLFISIAEECGLVPALGKQVLAMACREAAGWPAEVRVAVNLSPVQFDSGDLVRTVQEVLAETGLTPSRLQLEVTEGLVIRDVERVFAILKELRTLGIQILMDDFGVGYSSLSYFERFPFDKVKIDRSFVEKMLTSPAAAAVIEAVVGLGKRLGMGIVAEGVEREAQMEALVRIGCTHIQGYLISRPKPATEFAAVLEARAAGHEATRVQKLGRG